MLYQWSDQADSTSLPALSVGDWVRVKHGVPMHPGRVGEVSDAVYGAYIVEFPPRFAGDLAARGGYDREMLVKL